MKLVIASLVVSTAYAFAPISSSRKSTALSAFTIDEIPGALSPMGVFDPLGFGAKADEMLLKRYREAELTHGRVAMLATVGFLVGEAVEGSTPLFNGSVTGPAISHLPQVPPLLWYLLFVGIASAEYNRANIGWVDPAIGRFDKPGELLEEYVPGNLGFDPLGLKPSDPEEFLQMQNKELQNGRLAMIGAAGFLAQELVDGKGILEHLGFAN